MSKPRLRFAPSPTGYLHIGGVRTALFSWLWARKTGGTFILRFEDTDQERSTDASRALIFESMEWLGLDWDEGPFRQMDRLALYKAWAERLVAAGHAYRCYCTTNELDALRARSPIGFKYPGTCRDRRDEPDLPYVIRFKTERTGSITYRDLVFKRDTAVTTPNVELQDFVLLRADGVPLYNFGCVVDDITMGITVVVRGRDHMVNTPPQILLYQAFGAALPQFAHLPMLLGPDGQKLAKRHGSSSVDEFRDAGCAPGAVLNYVARLGWSCGDAEIFSRAQMIAAFDWNACGSSDGMINPKKLRATNFAHLRSEALLSTDEYARRLVPFVAARGLATDATRLLEMVFAVRDRAQTFVEAADLVDPFVRDSPTYDANARRVLTPQVAANLRGLRDALTTAGWSGPELEASTTAWLAASGTTLKEIGQPSRVALTGRTASPGLYEVLVLLGRDRALARLDVAAAIAERG